MRDLYFIGARLLGIYLLVTGVAAIPGVFGAYEAALNNDFTRPWVYVFSTGSSATVFILAGFTLTFLFKAPKHQVSAPDLSLGKMISAGSKFLGIYFLVIGLASLFGSIPQSIAMNAGFSWWFSDLAPGLVYLASGSYLLLRSRPHTAPEALKPNNSLKQDAPNRRAS